MKKSRQFPETSISRNAAENIDSNAFLEEPAFNPSAESIQMKKSEEQNPKSENHPFQLNNSKDSEGARLPKDTLSTMEEAFQSDFSNVKIKENSSDADHLGAKAFTRGNSIDFASGAYDPRSKSGQELIGHELTHVVQQRNENVQATHQQDDVAINADASMEREAEEKGSIAAKGEKTGLSSNSTDINQTVAQGFGWDDGKKLLRRGKISLSRFRHRARKNQRRKRRQIARMRIMGRRNWMRRRRKGNRFIRRGAFNAKRGLRSLIKGGQKNAKRIKRRYSRNFVMGKRKGRAALKGVQNAMSWGADMMGDGLQHGVNMASNKWSETKDYINDKKEGIEKLGNDKGQQMGKFGSKLAVATLLGFCSFVQKMDNATQSIVIPKLMQVVSFITKLVDPASAVMAIVRCFMQIHHSLSVRVVQGKENLEEITHTEELADFFKSLAIQGIENKGDLQSFLMQISSQMEEFKLNIIENVSEDNQAEEISEHDDSDNFFESLQDSLQESNEEGNIALQELLSGFNQTEEVSDSIQEKFSQLVGKDDED